METLISLIRLHIAFYVHEVFIPLQITFRLSVFCVKHQPYFRLLAVSVTFAAINY